MQKPVLDDWDWCSKSFDGVVSLDEVWSARRGAVSAKKVSERGYTLWMVCPLLTVGSGIRSVC